MEDWKEYTVQELIDKGMLAAPMDGNHGEKHPKTGDYVPTGIPFIMANNLIGGTVDYKNCAFISKTQANSLDKGFAKPGDVLLTHKATIGRTAIVPDDYDFIVLTPQVTYYRPLKGIDNSFLKYYFDTVQFQSLFKNWAGAGSTRAYLGITAQRKLPIVLPDIGTQKKITSILKSLDDEIEVNRRINDNLEQQAQALFKSWFVDFEPFKDGEFVYSELGMIPKGWKVGSIYEYIDVIYGAPYKSSLFNEDKDGLPLIRIRDLKTNAPQFYTPEILPNTEYIEAGDIVAGMDAEFIPYIWLGEKGVLNQRCCKFKTKNDAISNYYVLFLIKPELEFVQSYKTGTTVSHLGKSDIDRFKFIIPPINLLLAFSKIVNPFIKEVINRAKESRRLATLRDTLLPKLMSGELKVNEIEI